MIANSKKIQIPLDLLIRISDLLSYWELYDYDYSIQSEYYEVLEDIQKKISSMELRQAYSKMVFAKDEDERFYARIEYLKLKNKCQNNSQNNYSLLDDD
jgi:hypothetical protein